MISSKPRVVAECEKRSHRTPRDSSWDRFSTHSSVYQLEAWWSSQLFRAFADTNSDSLHNTIEYYRRRISREVFSLDSSNCPIRCRAIDRWLSSWWTRPEALWSSSDTRLCSCFAWRRESTQLDDLTRLYLAF